MSESPSGTPEVTPQPEGEKPDDSKTVTVSEQFKKEALESWKPAREEANRLKQELDAERARREALERVAYAGGRQATDPRTALVQQLQEQAQYDPLAQAALINMQESLEAKAEVWLANELIDIPDTKRSQVAALVRSQGYQLSPQAALKMVTDPESGTLAEKLAALTAENERLKSAKPHGISPAAASPSNASADDGRTPESVTVTEYAAILQQGGDKARALKQAIGSNKTKLVRG